MLRQERLDTNKYLIDTLMFLRNRVNIIADVLDVTLNMHQIIIPQCVYVILERNKLAIEPNEKGNNRTKKDCNSPCIVQKLGKAEVGFHANVYWIKKEPLSARSIPENHAPSNLPFRQSLAVNVYAAYPYVWESPL